MLDLSTLTVAREEYLLTCQVEGKAKRTLELYELVTRLLLEFLDGEQITPTRVKGFLAYLSQTRNATTVNIYCRALRTFCGYLLRNGYVDSDPMAGISTPKVPRVFPYVLSEEEVSDLIKVSKQNPRDYAIILFLLDTGVRASELCGISIDDLSLATRSARVFGKGDKERTVFFSDTTARALSRWLPLRNRTACDLALFLSSNNTALTRYGLLDIIRRLGKKAGIEGKRISPHTLRHTFATLFVMEGGDPHSLQKMLGHTTTKMAEVYVNLVGRDLAEAHRKYSPVGRITRHGKA